MRMLVEKCSTNLFHDSCCGRYSFSRGFSPLCPLELCGIMIILRGPSVVIYLFTDESCNRCFSFRRHLLMYLLEGRSYDLSYSYMSAQRKKLEGKSPLATRRRTLFVLFVHLPNTTHSLHNIKPTRGSIHTCLQVHFGSAFHYESSHVIRSSPPSCSLAGLRPIHG